MEYHEITKKYKVYKIVNGKEIEYADYDRLEKAKEAENHLKSIGFVTFVEEIQWKRMS